MSPRSGTIPNGLLHNTVLRQKGDTCRVALHYCLHAPGRQHVAVVTLGRRVASAYATMPTGRRRGFRQYRFHQLFEVAAASVPPKVPPLAATYPNASLGIRTCFGRSMTSAIRADFRSMFAHRTRATPLDLDRDGAGVETIRAPCTCKLKPARGRSLSGRC